MKIRVEVVHARPGQQAIVPLELEEGACVADAIVASGLPARFPGLDAETCKVGVWGRAVERSRRLRDGDRVEIYRPLIADPKQARRARAGNRPKRG